VERRTQRVQGSCATKGKTWEARVKETKVEKNETGD
jgi:hypothetical protein